MGQDPDRKMLALSFGECQLILPIAVIQQINRGQMIIFHAVPGGQNTLQTLLFGRALFGFRMTHNGAAVGGLRLRGTDKGVRVNRRKSDGKLEPILSGLDDAIRPEDLIFICEIVF